MNRKRFQRSTIISSGLVAFLLGLVFARWQGWHVAAWLPAATLPLPFAMRRRAVAVLAGVYFLGFTLGLWRGGVVLQEVAVYNHYIGAQSTLTGRVADDPVYDDKGRLDFRVSNVEADGQKLPGQIRVRSHVNGLNRADSVTVKGTLQEGFGNYQAAMYFGNVTITGHSANPIESLRRQFFAAVYSVLPEPEGSLGLGFLAGLRSALPEDLDEQLRVAGLTHIVVASGYNLTVLVRLSRRLLARRSKYQAMAGSLILIIGMVVVTGVSPSMMRAGVVTVLSLWAWYYGRRFHPMLIILLGAALTAGFNPLFMWHDLGWWLSFLAFTGVLVLAPLITVRFWGKKQPPLLVQVAVETTAAQMMALPLIMAVFGEVSLVSLLANIAVVPLIPFAMAATFVGGLAAIAAPAAAGWFAVPAHLIIQYIVAATRLFASFGWAKRDVAISQTGMYALYAVVAIIAFVLYRKTAFRFREAPAAVE